MRRILKDSEDWQIQLEDGIEYNYRKDFIAKGDLAKEYSLALMYSRKSPIVPPIVQEGFINGDASTSVREGAEAVLPDDGRR